MIAEVSDENEFATSEDEPICSEESGSDSSSEEELEDGQIESEDEDSNPEDSEVQECVHSKDIGKLRKILQRRKEECLKITEGSQRRGTKGTKEG